MIELIFQLFFYFQSNAFCHLCYNKYNYTYSKFKCDFEELKLTFNQILFDTFPCHQDKASSKFLSF